MKKGLLMFIVVSVSVVSGLVFFLIPQGAQVVRSNFKANDKEQKDSAAPQGGVLYFVTTLDDHNDGTCDADCTLHEAIQAANSQPGDDDGIDFGVTGIINLTSPLPEISGGVSIFGPGAANLTVQRNSGDLFRIFNVIVNVPDPATAPVNISGLTISGGRGVSSVVGVGGGGILNSGTAAVNVTNCVVNGNAALQGAAGVPTTGGGIYNNGTMNISNSRIISNQASGNTGASGGGIYNGGTMNIANSTIASNFHITTQGGDYYGGGIYNSSNGTMNITNSTIYGNHTFSENVGGGIYNGGTVNITNSTISGNGSMFSFHDGGGIYNITGASANVKNSIIALNRTTTSGPDVRGNFVSAGFNLIGKTDGSTGFTASTDRTGTIAAPLDPMLGPLQNNGGPTQTIALLFCSPAIDGGTSNGLTGNLTTDQRGTGFPRTIDDPAIPNAADDDANGTDIGAFELATPLAISGTVTYGNAVGVPILRFVSNVTITGAGSPTVMTTTLAPGPCAGAYSLTGFGAGSYTVTPTKTGGVNGITSFDAGRIAQHVAGTNILTGNALIVADVSGNGVVSSFDAAQIAQFVTSTGGMQTGTWKFVPVNRSYASVTSSIDGEDFIALLMGEVSGNWANTGARPVSRVSAGVSPLTWERIMFNEGGPRVSVADGKIELY